MADLLGAPVDVDDEIDADAGDPVLDDLDFDDDDFGDSGDTVRLALADYYGIEDAPAPAPAAAATSQSPEDGDGLASALSTLAGNSADGNARAAQSNKDRNRTDPALDLDSVDFDASKYVLSLLASNSMKELVEADNAMESSVSHLDGSMQRLVYENYNKFISATDMIRQMKDNVDSMEQEMNRLVDNMDSISKEASFLETDLHPNRAQVEKLVGVSRLIKRLEFLFELPARLNQSIDMGAHAQAVKYFTKANLILKQYHHVASFEKIRIESEKIMRGLKNTLRAAVKDPSQSSLQQMENSALLIELGESPEVLLDDIFKARRARLSQQLDEAVERVKQKQEKSSLQAQMDARVRQAKEEEEELWEPSDEEEEFEQDSAPLDDPELETERLERVARRQKDREKKLAAKRKAAEEKRKEEERKRKEEDVKPSPLLKALEELFVHSFVLFAQSFRDTMIKPYKKDPGAKETVRVATEKLTAFTSEVFVQYFTVARAELLRTADVCSSGLPPPPHVKMSSSVAALGSTLHLTDVASPVSSTGGDDGDEDTHAEAKVPLRSDSAVTSSSAAEVSVSTRFRRYQESSATGTDGPTIMDRVMSFTNSLKAFSMGLSQAAFLVPKARLSDRSEEIIQHCIRQCVENIFDHCESVVITYLTSVYRIIAEQYPIVYPTKSDKERELETIGGDKDAQKARDKERQRAFVQNLGRMARSAVLIREGVDASCRLLHPVLASASFLPGSLGSEIVDLAHTNFHMLLSRLSSMFLCDVLRVSDGPVHKSIGSNPLVKAIGAQELSDLPVFFLVLSQITLQFERKELSSLLSAVKKLFPVITNAGPGANRASAASAKLSQGLEQSTPALKAQLRETSQLLLQEYVETHGHHMTSLVRQRALTSGANSGDSHEKEDDSESSRSGSAQQAPTRVINMLINRIHRVQYELASVFASGERDRSGSTADTGRSSHDDSMIDDLPQISPQHGLAPATRSGAAGGGLGGNRERSSRELSLERDMERLFKQRVRVFPDEGNDVKFNRAWPLATVLKATYKALVESVRQERLLTMQAYAQTQADVYQLRSYIPSALGPDERNALEQLLDETLSSAGDRCKDLVKSSSGIM